ncbi:MULTISPECIES: MFS transporter [Bacillus]|uniref:MFS transporter n=2 Tax=Bacillus TaxID=1386 RepID=A0A0M4FRD8_9BACI|nr:MULTISPECIES: MFS transporter [Bacillus]ALC82060.1 MFS transporter [Bacillus gobiensis]MBP1083407.1 PPP family 3-phenylpropionic acid transporter [Bacillus capparidis]MED1097839.1 MFS transporter [Bacillus capparidis]
MKNNSVSVAEANSTKMFYSYYFLFFLGYGSFYPLLSVYLKESSGLTGSQIGLILSLFPVVMIFIQPMWGIFSDITKKPTALLTTALIGTGAFTMVFSFSDSFEWFIVISFFLAFFQSAIIPLSDSISISYAQKVNISYGSIRLWGAIGFALAVFIAGRLAEIFTLSIIFYLYTLFLFISALLVIRLPKETVQMKVNLKEGIKKLSKIPRYVFFLVSAFLMMGPILAHNIFFGIFIDEIGGTLAGVGIAFLLAAGSEAPFMKVAGGWIQRIGIENVLILSIIVASIRWFFYFFDPPVWLVYATAVTQGFSVGLFIPAALQYVKQIAPVELGATAISIYSAFGNGLGNWFCTFVGGIILEKYSSLYVYLFFGILSTLSLSIMIAVKMVGKNKGRDYSATLS